MWATITRLASDRMFSDKLNPHGLLGSVGLTRLAPAARRWCCGLRFSFSPTLSNPLKQQQRLLWLAGHDAECVEIVESRPDANHSVHCQAWNLEIPPSPMQGTLTPRLLVTSSTFSAASKPTGCPILVSTKGLDLKSWSGDKCRFFSNTNVTRKWLQMTLNTYRTVESIMIKETNPIRSINTHFRNIFLITRVKPSASGRPLHIGSFSCPTVGRCQRPWQENPSTPYVGGWVIPPLNE